MHKTKNDLPENVRKEIVELLNARLADAIHLSTQAKQAHWNVKGPSFFALHELFDKVYEAVTEYVDLIAERAVILGGTALGTAPVVAETSSISKYALDIHDGPDHVEALSNALAEFGALAREAIEKSETIGDVDTADLFTEVSRGIDKHLWFVEAHGQATR